MRHGKRHHRATAHAAAQQMRLLDIEMIEQALSLAHIVGPGDALNAPARLTAFAPIKNDALIMFGEMFQRLGLGVDAERRPLFQGGIKAAR